MTDRPGKITKSRNERNLSCSSIAGAADDNYTLVADDVGTRIQVRVTATSGGESASADSAPTATVTGITPPSNTSLPTITGSAVVGQSLAAANGGWAGTDPIGYAYLWRRCNSAGGSCSSIAGAGGAGHVLSQADVGRTIRVRVTASNGAGSAQATSDATSVVAAPAAAPTATARPGISVKRRSGAHAERDDGKVERDAADHVRGSVVALRLEGRRLRRDRRRERTEVHGDRR